MQGFIKCLMVLAIIGVLGVGLASADTTVITIGSSSQNVTFTAATTPDTTMTVQLGSCVSSICTLSGSAFDPSEGTVGTYAFTTDTTGGNITVTFPEIPTTSTYPVFMNGASTSFQYSNSGNVLQGTVIWNLVNDSSPNPTLKGSLTMTSVTGTAAFQALFAGLTTVPIDFTLSSMTGTNNTLTALFDAGSGALNGNTVSAGQVNTPEPTTIALFGSGLLTLGGFLRRRKNVGQ